MLSRTWTTSILAAASLLSVQAQLSGNFDILTYNVAGLPEQLSGSKPKENTPLISARLGNYSIVHVQEDFNYHDLLYNSDKHVHRTQTSGPVPIGSGLNTLSDFPFTDLQRKTWKACWFGSGDCLTPKGFTAMRLTLAPGVSVDFYNLHAEAGDDTLDFLARTAGYQQLSEFITTYSAGNAVILAGDSNTRYTAAKDPIRLLTTGTPGLTDVWVQLEKGGTPPTAGTPSIECPFPVKAGKEDLKCEQIDKVLYRSSPLITLSPQKFLNENPTFLRPDGGPLSDHFPIAVPFDWSVSESLRASAKALGGQQGDYFNDLATYKGKAADKTAASTVSSISFRGGSRLDQVSYGLSDGRTVSHGGSGGGATKVLNIAGDETVTEVELCDGQRNGGETGVFYARVSTSKGQKLEAGKKTGRCEVFKAGSGFTLAGFWGRKGNEVDLLGVYWGKK